MTGRRLAARSPAIMVRCARFSGLPSTPLALAAASAAFVRAEIRTDAQIRASCGVLWRAWSDGVGPLRGGLVALDIEACHLLVADLDPLRIAPRVQHAVHDQPACRCGRGNQIHDGCG